MGKKDIGKKEQITDIAKLKMVMDAVVKKGYTKYVPTKELIKRKHRGRNYYGVLLTHEFAKAFFGSKFRLHLKNAVEDGDILQYFVDSI